MHRVSLCKAMRVRYDIILWSFQTRFYKTSPPSSISPYPNNYVENYVGAYRVTTYHAYRVSIMVTRSLFMKYVLFLFWARQRRSKGPSPLQTKFFYFSRFIDVSSVFSILYLHSIIQRYSCTLYPTTVFWVDSIVAPVILKVQLRNWLASHKNNLRFGSRLNNYITP